VPRHLEPHLGDRPRQILQKLRIHQNPNHSVTRAWVQREISNFEYLSYLNFIAGRTYSDLAQYPVFPWVVRNYTSPRLDLRDPHNFRDLRWPMGAQERAARERAMEHFAMLQEDYQRQLGELEAYRADPGDYGMGPPPAPMPPFNHGTHYSTAGFVIWYLLRLEPFTSLHVHLQSGRFDHADRQFASIPQAFKGCISNQSDVKELIPEFFYQPEFLYNLNKVDLGRTQNGLVLDDVVLPAWARTPEEFIRLHREALESEFVSANLHHWIDLIFGYKQRPPHLRSGHQASVDACNVFFNITYQDALDLDSLEREDPLLYQSTLRQIQEFGQTPVQLFTKQHPTRLPLHRADVIWPIASIVPGANTTPNDMTVSAPQKPTRLLSFKPVKVSTQPVVGIFEALTGDRLVTVDAGWVTGLHGWQVLSPDVHPPFKLKFDSSISVDSGGASFLAAVGADRGRSKARSPSPDRSAVTETDDDESVASASPRDGFRKGEGLGGGDASLGMGYFDFAVDAENQLFFTCGYLDYSFKVTTFGEQTFRHTVPHSVMQSIAQHRDVVRCIAIGKDWQGRQCFLVTGSSDCTVMVWEVGPRTRPVMQAKGM
jgi:hypothetical protein